MHRYLHLMVSSCRPRARASCSRSSTRTPARASARWVLGARPGRHDGVRDGLVGAARVPGPRDRDDRDCSGDRAPAGRAAAPPPVGVPVGREPRVERDLPQARLRARRDRGVRVSEREREHHALQQLAPRALLTGE